MPSTTPSISQGSGELSGLTATNDGSKVRVPGPTPRPAIIASNGNCRERDVAQLIVRNLSEELVRALKQRAAKHNRSAEQEHREILQAALRSSRRRSLADVLGTMPNVGDDRDFLRKQSDRRG